jgi:hypothetical protein
MEWRLYCAVYIRTAGLQFTIVIDSKQIKDGNNGTYFGGFR